VVVVYLDRHVLLRISRVLDVVGNGVLLMDEQGKVIYPEGDKRQLTLPEAVTSKPGEPVVYGGVTLIGVRDEADEEETCSLYVCLSGDSTEVCTSALLCAELINMCLQTASGNSDKNHSLRRILRGECTAGELNSVANEYGIPICGKRIAVCIYNRSIGSEKIIACLNSCDWSGGGFFTELSQNMLAAVISLPEESSFNEVSVAAHDLFESLNLSGCDIVLGVSDPRSDLGEICDAFNEARDAINVGAVYRPHERILVHRKLMLERFLYAVPRSSSQEYSAKIFNSITSRLFTEEMVNTIEVFFASNLNLSEASRKLGIHRNTLVYRLEKVQTLTGFDLREFDDAVTFRMIMLLNRNSNAQKIRI